MSRHIWNMRKSDTNDNLVTFGPLQHIRLKIKREKRAFLIFSKVFSFLFFFFLSFFLCQKELLCVWIGR